MIGNSHPFMVEMYLLKSDKMEKGEPTRDQLLKMKKAEIRVRRNGMFQRIVFTIKTVEEPYGKYPVLFTDRIIDLSEAVRLAEELQIPVEIPSGTTFPKGKTGKDFVFLMEKM